MSEAQRVLDVRVGALRLTHTADFEAVRAEIDRVDASGSRLPGATLRDVRIRGGECSNAAIPDARLRRIHTQDVGATGLDASGASMEDIRLRGCKFRLALGFGARLTRCVFDGCDLREADFEGAVFDRVVFRACDLTAARLGSVDLGRCDIRGSRVEGLVVSPDRLQGLVVDPTQLPTFARVLGLDVQDTPRP
ncbi:MAG: pentapeptide repeat-containing protein [Planctomycetota bacterium]